MGSPAFAVPSLRALIAAKYRVVGVVTQPDRPAGRGGRVVAPPVKGVALEHGIELLQPETLKDDATGERLASWRPDLIVVAAYGRILPRSVLALARRGCVNVHASLLPRWRGASPIAAAILAGDAETGVTIMEMAPKMDAGAAIASGVTPILSTDTTGSLERRLAELGAALLVAVLPAWYDGSLVALPQDEALVTVCRPIEKSEGHLRATMTAEEAERAVRAYDPWPGAFVLYRGERLAVRRASLLAGGEATPGSLRLEGRRPVVAFAGGSLVLDEVQRPGGNRISGEQFVNGERGALAPEVGLG